DLGTATIGFFYSRQFFACCSPSIVWSVASGDLPPGLALSSDGVLSGTATSAGRYTFLVRAADPANNGGARQFTLVVTPLFQTTSYVLPNGFVNTPYDVMLTVGGGTGPYTWTLAHSNALPPGVTLDSTGALRGMPA